MKKSIKTAGLFILQIAIILAVFVGVKSYQTRDMLETDGSVFIEPHNLVSLEGEVVQLPGDGKRKLVYFFAPWCSICEVSVGKLAALEQENLSVMTVALDYETVKDVESFVTNNNVNTQVLLGTENTKQLFRIKGYPSYYLLDENNKVVGKSFGLNNFIGIKISNLLSQI